MLERGDLHRGFRDGVQDRVDFSDIQPYRVEPALNDSKGLLFRSRRLGSAKRQEARGEIIENLEQPVDDLTGDYR